MMRIVILGNGISGVTAARHIRKQSDHPITIISSETPYFFSRTALMYVYMGHMRFQDTQPYENNFWVKNRIDLVQAHITDIHFGDRFLLSENGEKIFYDKLILALGSKPNKFGWPGQDLQAVHGLYHKQDLEAMEKHSKGLKRAVIVGGGLIGLEMAEMFLSRHIPVTFLVREPDYWRVVLPAEESAMVSRHIRHHGIDLRLSTELKEIIDDGNGKACAVMTHKNERIDCGFVGLTAGVSPNVAFLKKTELAIGRGIQVNEFLKTNQPHVYAIGDCAEMLTPKAGRRPIEAVWYTGRMMGETVAQNICGKKTAYQPGIWFNSAKFLDIEYQVYGTIPSILPQGIETIYWEHPDGDKSIRINYRKDNGTVTGFNLMGIRYRHQVCEKWIKSKAHIEEVLMHLALANFDPEFFKTYEQEILATYNQQTGKSLRAKSQRRLS
ncbi:MAG TPA: NAD(P)/FAD-dependent oxidoreductase, partial [Saprospiraceae bacterium]|nr:NAD(P)/FAD-dependent oxidoreductase [Saprospiraceae bacterium]